MSAKWLYFNVKSSRQRSWGYADAMQLTIKIHSLYYFNKLQQPATIYPCNLAHFQTIYLQTFIYF